MNVLFLVFSFILGTLIGSFLNVVSLRFNTGMTLGGRSKCFSCGKTLTWSELIPVFSFLFQSGKCRKCKTKISWQYPIVETISGIIFVLIFIYFPPIGVYESINTVFYLVITCILLVITVYDIKHKIIPDSLSYSFAIIAFIHMFISKDLTFIMPPIYEIIAGPIIASPFVFLWIISKGKWLGLGDAKLVLGIGYTLGLFASISSLILSFWIGAFVGVAYMLFIVKKYKKGYELPFGPYLILGMYIVLFTNITIIDIPSLISLIK
jgi:prepilin signal peptidase PulO-like enzyme (type II secretory pathway)